MKSPVPPNEALRLKALRGTGLMDTPPEREFDDLARLAAEICGTPIALISLVDEKRQWFKARIGIESAQFPRETAFCAFALTEPDVWSVPDSQADARFSDNPLVTGTERIRFYAGAPLVTDGGETLGTLCVLDRVPRRLSKMQEQALRVVRDSVMNLIRLRHQFQEWHLLQFCMSRVNDVIMITEARPLAEPGPRILYANEAFERLTGYTVAEALGRNPRILQGPKTDRRALDRIRAALEQNRPIREEVINYTKSGREYWLELDMVPVTDAQGKATHIVAIERDVTERKNADETFRAERALLAMAARMGRLGAWRLQIPHWQLTWSEEVRAMHEVDDSYVPDAETAIAFYAPEYRDRIRQAVNACAEYGLAFDQEMQIVTARGRRIWVRVLGEAVRGEGQQISMVQGAIQDISDRKAAEEANQALAEKLVRTLENITDAFIVMDRDWRISYVNREAERMLRRPRAELLERNVWTEFPEAEGSRFEQEYRRAVAEQVTVGFEEFFAPLNTWFSVRAFPSEQGLAVSFRDITSGRKQEAALRASEERFRMLFAYNPQPMWVYDVSSARFIAVNAAAAAHYGYAQAEFLGLTLRDIWAPEDWPALNRFLGELDQRPKSLLHCRHRKKDGTIIESELSSNGVVLDGRPAQLVQVVDITERLRAEGEAMRANRALLMLSRCNEALVRSTAESELLSRVCQIAVEVGGFRLAWVGYAADDAAKSIVPQAHAGHEDGYLQAIKLSWSEDSRSGRGPAGRTIRSGKINLVLDLADAREHFVFLEEAQCRGYQGLICLPLKEKGQGSTFGLLALHWGEPVNLPEREIQLLQELADDLVFGLINLRSRMERRRTHEAVLTMARGISAAVDRDFFQKLTLSLTVALDADVGFVAILDPPGSATARTLCAVEAGRVMPNFTADLADLPVVDLAQTAVWVRERDAWRAHPTSRLLAEKRIEAFAGTKLVDTTGQPIGVMFVHLRKPMPQPEFVVSILQIFAARAAAEIQRQVADVTTREQAALLDKATDAIIVCRLDHRISFWNQSAEGLYGWAKDEALSQSSRDLLSRNPTAYDEAMNHLLTQGHWAGEMEQKTKAGQALTVEGRWSLVRDDDGQPTAVLAIYTDITERKKLEQQFLRAQRMESIGTLAGGIAHDLNNLLAPITLGADVLDRGNLVLPAGAPLLESIKRSADRGANLVKQVLAFARGVESQKINLDVTHVLREVHSLVESSFPKNIAVDMQFAPQLALVMADPTQLHQVLVNLCVNARDAMPAGGRLSLSVREADVDEQYAAMNLGSRPGHYVVIEVTDTGSGMSKQVMDRIFEPFYTTKEFGKGTGLGLATTVGIVRGHGGFVTVYSEVGKGSTFQVYLPAQAGGVAPGAPPAEESLPLGSGELILLVDDEAAIREVTQRSLESFGYRVLTAEDGAHAISTYAEHRDEVALVLTDMMMPVMDGLALSRALQRLDPQLPIIGASGLTANAPLAQSGNWGMTYFLAKPYSAAAMLKMISLVLAEKRGRADPPGPR